MSFKQEILNKSESLELCYYKYIKVLNLKDSEGSFNLFIKDLFVSLYKIDNANPFPVDVINSTWYFENGCTIIIKDNDCNRDYLIVGSAYMTQCIVKLHKRLDEFKE